MDILNLKLAEIKPYEKNPRRNDKAVKYVAESIKNFGFKVPIVIDKDHTIVCGHTRYKAAKKLKLKTVPCILADDLTEEQIKAFRLADNKVGESSEWDFDILSEELNGILDINMSDFGFDKSERELTKEQEKIERELLEDIFLIAPFSILDQRSGAWQSRAKKWRKLIGDSGEARGNSSLFSSMIKFAINQNKCNKNDAHANGSSILDPVLSEIICSWFSPDTDKGNKAFDVFAGDTVFGYVASTLGFDFTGIELREEQAMFNNDAMERGGFKNSKYICDDGRNVCKHIPEKSQDLFFSCPPYFNIETYSNKSNDASNQKTYEEFYKILDSAFTEASKCLKDNRFAVVVASDIRNPKTGGYYPFCDDIKATFRKNGFEVYNELILIRCPGSMPLFARKKMETRKVTRTHEEVLVFYKGKEGKVSDMYGDDFIYQRRTTPTHSNVMVFYKKEDDKNTNEEIKKDFSVLKKEYTYESKNE